MNQSEFLANTCNSLEAREKSRVHFAIGFGFASHWLQNWCECFKPISKGSNRNHVITFDSHLKKSLNCSGDTNPNLCDTCAVLYQLSYLANWQLVVLWVDTKPVDDGYV